MAFKKARLTYDQARELSRSRVGLSKMTEPAPAETVTSKPEARQDQPKPTEAPKPSPKPKAAVSQAQAPKATKARLKQTPSVPRADGDDARRIVNLRLPMLAEGVSDEFDAHVASYGEKTAMSLMVKRAFEELPDVRALDFKAEYPSREGGFRTSKTLDAQWFARAVEIVDPLGVLTEYAVAKTIGVAVIARRLKG